VSKINVVTSKLGSDQPILSRNGWLRRPALLVPFEKMKKGVGVALACLQATSAAAGGGPDAETRRLVSVMEGKGQGACTAGRI
jgi:hypothetical protein